MESSGVFVLKQDLEQEVFPGSCSSRESQKSEILFYRYYWNVWFPKFSSKSFFSYAFYHFTDGQFARFTLSLEYGNNLQSWFLAVNKIEGRSSCLESPEKDFFFF